MKLNDLLEQRAAIVDRMTAAHTTDDNDAFTAAETELRALDAKLDRQKKIDAAERTEIGTPINGDNKLGTDLLNAWDKGNIRQQHAAQYGST